MKILAILILNIFLSNTQLFANTLPPEESIKQNHEVWVLLRGQGRQSKHWDKLPEILTNQIQKTQPGKKIVSLSIDLPGTGIYSQLVAPISIQETAEFVHDKYLLKLKELNINPDIKVNLVAISLGGMVASEWLSRWSHELDSCILINTSFSRFSSVTQRLKPESVKAFGKALTQRDPIQRELEVLKLVSNRQDLHETTAQLWANIGKENPISSRNFMRQLFAAAKYKTPFVEGPKTPVLILSGGKDRMVDPSCSREIARQWNKELRVNPEAGHDLPLDATSWTMDQIVSWQGKLK